LIDRNLASEIFEGYFQDFQAVLHRKNLLDLFVVQDQSHSGSSTLLFYSGEMLFGAGMSGLRSVQW
jgi:hypothetical protein